MKNQIVWFDLPVLDLARATAFYEKVLGVTLSKMAGDAMEMATFPGAGQPGVSGCITVCTDVKPSADGALMYFDADGRLDEAESAVVPAGGKVLEPKHAIGPWGFRVVALDSEGNRIALHSSQ
jgi:predicted enzyme related to lactoylglutathione lyase